MSQKNIDYSCTVIYKITCKDPAVTDLYVGHTTDFVKRRAAHKRECLQSDCKLYKTIRDNGGWTNWSMEALTFFNCQDLIAAKTKEQEYFVALKATLNSVEPLGNKKIKEEVDGKEKKNKVKKEKIIEPIVIEPTVIHPKRFTCVSCNYNCNKESDYNKHLLTPKHKKNIDSLDKLSQSLKHKCICGKMYSFRQGLSIHKNKCKLSDYKKDESDINIYSSSTLTQLIKDNTEFKKISLDLLKSNTNMQKLLAEVINKIT